MKTFNSFKNTFVLLAILFSYIAMAQSNYELSLVRDLDTQTSELTFMRTEGEKKSTIVATDDDGFLSLSTINIVLNQNTTEALKVVADAARKRGEDPLAAVNAKWNNGMADEELAKFPSLKPAILSSLTRYAEYSARLSARINALIQKTNNPELLQKLQRDLQTAIAENTDALYVHSILKEKDTLTRRELSSTLGSMLKAYKGSHSYEVTINGNPQKLSLTGANALGLLFGARAYRIDEHFLTEMKAKRGTLFLAKDVFANTSGETVEASSDTISTEHVDSVVERLLEADSIQ